MKIKLYQVDAFTDTLFCGNPAAVCPLGDEWLSDAIMQNIASENNLAETAFYIKKNNIYYIRWFTPTVEVDLCGHATLAAAHVIFNHENFNGSIISFDSKSGILSVTRNRSLLSLNFPADKIEKKDIQSAFSLCFSVQHFSVKHYNVQPLEVYKGISDYLFIFDNEKQIQNMKPNLSNIAGLDARGVIITALGDGVDFVSRCFFPQLGINEDPVTGSAHTTLVPYWSKRLSKDILTARQISSRVGNLYCKNLGNRIEISGNAVTYLIGEIEL